jgi:hypothetical protein
MKQCLPQKEAAAEVGISRGRLNRMKCFVAILLECRTYQQIPLKEDLDTR